MLYETSGTATLRDTATGQVLTAFASEWSDKQSLFGWIESLDPSGRLVAIRSPDNSVRIYRTQDGAMISDLSWDTNEIAAMAFSADSRRLLLVTNKGRFANWDIAAARAAPSPMLPREYSSYLNVPLKRTPDGSRMPAIDQQGYVDLYSLNTNTVRTFYSGESDQDANAALSPDGSILAVLGSSGMLRLWHVGSREILAQIPVAGKKHPELKFSADGRVLAAGDGTRLILVPLIGDALLKAATAVAGITNSSSEMPAAAQTYRFGIFTRDVSPEIAKIHQLHAAHGAEIIEIVPDSVAQAAGLRVGDLIVGVDDKAVGTAAEALAALEDAHPSLSLDIIRGTASLSVRAVLPD